jgi:MFS family permease
MTSTVERHVAVATPQRDGTRPERRGFAMVDALAVPDFRKLWIGSLISNIGSWMQFIGSGWLVLQLTHSPFWLGLVSFVSAIPILLFSLFAGVLADRVDRRRLLMVTQAAASVLALLLGLLTSWGVVRMSHIIAITFVSGTAMAFNMPAWQAMIPDLVGKDRLMNAVGLNSAAFNAAAVVGPAIAGTTVSALGVATCFYLNAASYLAVLIALWRIRSPCAGADCTSSSVSESLRQGVVYISRHRIIFVLFWLAAVASLLARPYIQLMPSFAQDVLHGGPRTYGVLMAANGLGALVGALVTAMLHVVHRKGLLLLGSLTVLSVALVAFAASRNVILSLVALILVGGGATLFMGMTNTLLQTSAPDEVRGRLMSIYSLIAAGFMPLGGLLVGSMASVLGSVSLVVALGAGIVLVNVIIIGGGAHALRRMT